MGRQCMFLERAVESEGKQTVQYASLHRPEWLLGFNGRKRRLETTPQGDKIALARSVWMDDLSHLDSRLFLAKKMTLSWYKRQINPSNIQ